MACPSSGRGMSVAPDSPWHVPNHRRPPGMGRGSAGKVQDWIFGINDDAIRAALLAARLDPRNPKEHAFIEAVSVLTLSAYTAALTTTQTSWRRVWP